MHLLTPVQLMGEKLKLAEARATESNVQSSRSSFDVVPSPGRVASPTSRGRVPSVASVAGSEGAQGTGSGKQVDAAYLKNVLLQFLEQKDKKHQMQLVPVLGMLLHFDR